MDEEYSGYPGVTYAAWARGLAHASSLWLYRTGSPCRHVDHAWMRWRDDGDNNTSTPPAPGSNLTNATASNLANRVFTFPNGFSTNLPHLLGFPQDRHLRCALAISLAPIQAQ